MTKRRAPYVLCLEKRGPLAIWSVDGSYVRKNIDEEFSNFGHQFSISEIPRGELWIEVEGDPDEQRFFVHHALVERRMMLKGADYDTARFKANKEERQMRVAAGDLRKVIKGKALPDADLIRRGIWKTLPSGVQVWFVKGRLVRSVYDIEFTEGGHEHVYEYIPRGEVWIDDDIHENERGFVLFHELHERNLMADGMDYDTAHDESSKLEKHYRKHPDELHEALAREGWE
ncbi:MAG: hypothetical protein NVSMB53_17000 [Gemmatimonadaceae bacterium]